MVGLEVDCAAIARQADRGARRADAPTLLAGNEPAHRTAYDAEVRRIRGMLAHAVDDPLFHDALSWQNPLLRNHVQRPTFAAEAVAGRALTSRPRGAYVAELRMLFRDEVVPDVEFHDVPSGAAG